MTIFEKSKLSTIDETVDWLDKYGNFDDSPWMVWFDNKYCKNCETIMCGYANGMREFPFSWCELNGKCKFLLDPNDVPDGKQIIKMWLESEATENE